MQLYQRDKKAGICVIFYFDPLSSTKNVIQNVYSYFELPILYSAKRGGREVNNGHKKNQKRHSKPHLIVIYTKSILVFEVESLF